MGERVQPLGQVMANGYVEVKDNEVDFSGSIVHPKEGPGMYMAPLDPTDPKALATRIHEYTHLQLITSEIQPTGLHAAFDLAGIQNSFLQAMADAKVMTYCQERGVSLKDLVVISDTSNFAVDRIKSADKGRQANLLLRSIGTDLFDFANKSVTLTEKQKTHIVENVFEKIKEMRTLEDWVRVGLEYQRAFETPRAKSIRKSKTDRIMPKGEEKGEGEGTLGSGIGTEGDKPKKPRDSIKKDMEKFKDVSKKVVEMLEEAGALKPKSVTEAMEESGETRIRGGKAVSEEKAKTLDVSEKEKKDKTDIEDMVQELQELRGSLDEKVFREPAAMLKARLEVDKSAVAWGEMRIHTPIMDKPFEPKNRSRRAKRSYVGAFRYPHRIVSDSAVFASKQRGKGGTLLIDCSGSMGVHYTQLLEVLEQRPFATIALYASTGWANKEGILVLVVDRGKRVTEEALKDCMLIKMGSGNVVDGPAIDWLCKRAGEKFWICDGGVTGVNDMSSMYLRAYVAIKERRYKIKRWQSLNGFLEGKKPDYE
jgi:hypothetical protein